MRSSNFSSLRVIIWHMTTEGTAVARLTESGSGVAHVKYSLEENDFSNATNRMEV